MPLVSTQPPIIMIFTHATLYNFREDRGAGSVNLVLHKDWGNINLLPNPEEAVVVVGAPKPNAVGAVVLAANEPNENPEVP